MDIFVLNLNKFRIFGYILDVIILFLSVHFEGVLIPISLAYFLVVHFFFIVFLSHCDLKM